jgi:hypothetical protein
MAGLPVGERRRIEEAEADALTLALLQAMVATLAREALATANGPRLERLDEMDRLLDTLRRRAITRKH